MNHNLRVTLITAALCAAAPLTSQATAVTYDFTGKVTSPQGIYSGVINVGDEITGTYTIDYANTIASQGTGTPGSVSGWDSVAQGGTALSLPPVSGVVFSSTANVDGITYSSYAPSTWFNLSYVEGGGTLTALEQGDINDGADAHYSYFNLSDALGHPYDSNGLPVLIGAGNGYFETTEVLGNAPGSGTVYYDITSLTPASISVPEPAATWLLLTGLLGLVAWPRVKRSETGSGSV